jgi:hypothetical protein
MTSTGFLHHSCIYRPILRVIAAGLALGMLLPMLNGQTRVAVLAGFDQPPDGSSVEWMEQEAAAIFSDAGVTFSWQPLKQYNSLDGADLFASVQFHGSCRFEPGAIMAATNGPMAWIQSQDGEIRPFIEVDCDRTAAMVWQNRGGLPLPLVRRALGRALGRVLAHEIYHYVTQSVVHNSSELFSHAMSSRDLMLPQARFDAGEVENLRKGMSRPESTGEAAARHPDTD